MKKAAAYARVSTQHQSRETSIEAQLELIREFAKQRGIEIVDEFYDKDSGGKVSRKNFDKMIKNALEGKYDLIIVDKFDRFFREGVEDQRLTKILESRGIHVIAVLEPVDPSTPAGWFARWIFSGMYEMQRRYIAEETKRKMRYVARKGYWMGGKPPYGYKVVEVKDSEGKIRKKLVPDEEEAPVIKEIFKMYAEGFGIAKIADILNKKGIKTKRGGEWTKSTLYDILRNEKYIGVYTYSKGTKRNHHARREDVVRIEGAIEPIIDKDLWMRVNERIKERRYTSGVSKHVYLLRGLVYCGICGAPMVASPRSHNKAPMYVCSAWKQKRSHEYLGISKKKLEEIVDAYIEAKLFYKPIDFEELARKMNDLEDLTRLSQNREYSELTQKLHEVENEIENILTLVKKGISSETIVEELKKLEKEKREISTRLESLSRADTKRYTAEELEKHWKKLEKMFRSFDDEEKREFYLEVIEKVVVYPNGYVEIKLKE